MYGSWKLLNNSEAIFPMSHSFTLHKIGFVYGNKRNLERKIFFLHSVSNIYCKSICNIYVHLPTENVMAKMLKRRRSVMKTPLYDPPPPTFFKFCSTPLLSLLSPTPTSTDHSVVLFLWLNGWSRHIWWSTLWICTCQALGA